MSTDGFAGAESLPELVQQIGRLKTDPGQVHEVTVTVVARLTELGVQPFG